jgi:hypothetical protein
VAELEFLDAMRARLVAAPFVPNVPAGHVGAVVPNAAADLPAIVLSLDETTRIRVGLGERSELMTGALPVRATIDLASPFLPTDPTFSLVDAPRTHVVIPHGGLVLGDGSDALDPLSPTDCDVLLDGNPVDIVPGAPGPNEVQVDPVVGQLTFGTPLPNAGTLEVDYFLGQWERRVERASGVLRVDACAATGADAERLGADVVRRLLPDPTAAPDPNLLALSLTELSRVVARPAPPSPATFFRRRARFAFDYQLPVDRVESSGGVIRRIPITTRLLAQRTDARTGAVVTEIVVETA